MLYGATRMLVGRPVIGGPRTHSLQLDVLGVSTAAGVPPDTVSQKREVICWVLAMQLIPEPTHLYQVFGTLHEE